MDTRSTAFPVQAAIKLRPYQRRAVQALRNLFRSGCRLLLLVAPTGAGKTVVGAHVMASAHSMGRRVLFLAHRRELIDQTYRKLTDAGLPPEAIGVLMGTDKRANLDAPIQVASVDTLRNRAWPPADLVIVDEAHRSLAATYLRVIDHYAEHGAAVVGLTATPYRADGGGLGDVYEALEVVATPRELIAEGYIVEPRAFAGVGPDLRGLRVRGGDYAEGELAEAMNRGGLVGNIVSHWQRYAEGRRTVCFAVSVEHSRHIVERFQAAGVPAEHLDGTTPTDERAAILARLERGETLIVSNVGVLCEGWDQPSVKCAILARPTKSTGLYLQQAGRILRPWEGVGALILDHAGNAIEHGLPQDDREFSLEGTTAATPSARKCDHCGAVCALNAEQCPECSQAFEPPEPAPERKPNTDESDAELTEIRATPTAELVEGFRALVADWHRINQRRLDRGDRPIKPGWIKHRFVERFGRKPPAGCQLPPEIATDDEKLEALQELQQVARQRGYKRGWVRHRFAARFGHSPAEVAA